MRTHLQHHDAGALIGDFPLMPGDFPLLAKILLNLVGQDEAVHGQGGEDNADIEQRVDIDKGVYEQRNGHRQQCRKKTLVGFAGKMFPAADRACEIQQHGQSHRQQQKRVQRPAEILPVRRDIAEAACERGGRNQDKIYGPKDGHSPEEPAVPYVFSAAVQQIDRQHGQGQREKKRFQNQQENDRRNRNRVTEQERFKQGGKAVQHQDSKKKQEETFAPAVNAGHDDGEPQCQHA